MARRRKPVRYMQCAEPGCAERTLREFSNQREYVEHYKRTPEWRCLRHSMQSRVLSPTNTKTEWISEPALPSQRFPDLPRTMLFWGSLGLMTDRAYFAAADDFPEGTRIKVTAEVILPDQAPMDRAVEHPVPEKAEARPK